MQLVPLCGEGERIVGLARRGEIRVWGGEFCRALCGSGGNQVRLRNLRGW